MNSYTKEGAQRILLALLKQNGIRHLIASPGSTNISFVVSAQHDPFFKLYSAPDERSAAYMACGMADALNEPVVISCTGATASRNYLPALTEAFYRKLPVIAVTAITSVTKRYHLFPQIIDRSNPPADACRFLATLPFVKDNSDALECNFLVNKAIAEARRDEGGPVILEIQTDYLNQFSNSELPHQRVIRRHTLSSTEKWPNLNSKKTAIFIGAHRRFNEIEIAAIDDFCRAYNAVVFCDHTSGYYGAFAVNFSLVNLLPYRVPERDMEVLIHLGEISGDYYGRNLFPQSVWRVSEDGEMRDTFGKLNEVFESDVISFFKHFTPKGTECSTKYYEECSVRTDYVLSLIPELPFSNIWCAQALSPFLPKNSTLHLAILNSLRSWNFFKIDSSIRASSNVGGFGIDGPLSTSIGSALAEPNRVNTVITGDLAFFYDLNSLGNRHLPANLRILLINNGRGVEFRNKSHIASAFCDEADNFVAAANHYGAQSEKLVRHFAEDIGIDYLHASSKEEFLSNLPKFTTSEQQSKPMLFEVFVDWKDDREALDFFEHLDKAPRTSIKQFAKETIKGIIGPKASEMIHNIRK